MCQTSAYYFERAALLHLPPLLLSLSLERATASLFRSFTCTRFTPDQADGVAAPAELGGGASGGAGVGGAAGAGGHAGGAGAGGGCAEEGGGHCRGPGGALV